MSQYWAFLSYSHADERWARWLQRSIETYVVPQGLVGRSHPTGEIPRRLFPVFRDRDEVGAGAELSTTIRTALAASRYLIVLCSPASATSAHVNEEIRHFQSLDRRGRILSLIVGGEPNALDPDDSCFPPALVGDPGEAEGSEPIAADARPQSDGPRLGALKILAGLLNVALDELRQRERQRQRRIVARRIAVSLVALTASLTTYLVGADLGINLPGSNTTRDLLDRRDMSVFRRPHAPSAIGAAAADLRNKLRTAIMQTRDNKSALFAWQVGAPGSNPDAWSSAQALCALAVAPELRAVHKASILATYERLTTAPYFGEYGGMPAFIHEEGLVPRGPAAFWLARSLAVASRRDDVFSESERDDLRRQFALVSTAVETFRVDASGGWNIFPNLADPSQHDAYSTVLALLMLLDARASALAFGGSERARDEAIERSARWLVDAYDWSSSRPGWRRRPGDQLLDTYDGLTLQIYAALLWAEQEGFVGIDSMIPNVTWHLTSCEPRPVDFPEMGAEFTVPIIEGGRKRSEGESVAFLWHPWAIESSARWLRRAARYPPTDPVEIAQVRRVLSHLVIGLGDHSSHYYLELSSPTFKASEYLVGLSAVVP